MTRTTKFCDECGSNYFNDSSEMESLCPECASVVYGYEPCLHEFNDNRCIKCHWDGSVSEYVSSLKNGK